jgi:hypothetical protein
MYYALQEQLCYDPGGLDVVPYPSSTVVHGRDRDRAMDIQVCGNPARVKELQ